MITKIPMEQGSGRERVRNAPVDPPVADAARAVLERKFIEFLETGELPEGLVADNVFLDFTIPLWWLQASGIRDAVALQRSGHPSPGRVPRWRTDRTDRGIG